MELCNTVIHGRWENWLPEIPGASIDMALLDLPYNITANPYDKQPVDLELLWKELKRVGKPNTAYVFTASQPFTSLLIMSNWKWFKHEWIWKKNAGSNFGNTKREPMKEHESVLVFYDKLPTYNPQMQLRAAKGLERVKYQVNYQTSTANYGEFEGKDGNKRPDLRVPSSVQEFNRERGLHPNQKPVLLFSYLIKTYSNPGDTVLDVTAGSFTTAEACIITGRNWICMEEDEKYCQVGRERITRLNTTPKMQTMFDEMVG